MNTPFIFQPSADVMAEMERLEDQMMCHGWKISNAMPYRPGHLLIYFLVERIVKLQHDVEELKGDADRARYHR